MLTQWIVVTHPDNVQQITKNVNVAQEMSPFLSLYRDKPYQFEIITDRYLPKEQWSGKYTYKGKTLAPHEVYIPDGRFMEWTPNDIWWLLKEGIIEKHMHMLVYLIDKTKYIKLLNFQPSVLF